MNLPVVNRGPQRFWNVIELLIGRIFSNYVVARVHQTIERQEICSRRAIGLQDVVRIHVAIELGNFGLKAWGAFNPAVVHLLGIEHLVKLRAMMTIQIHQLVHRQ